MSQRRTHSRVTEQGTTGRTRSVPRSDPPLRQPWIIVADDLTGATDAAAPFAARGHRCAILLDPRQPQPGGFDVLSISTNSRTLSGLAAAATLRRLCRRLERAGQRIDYKKFDSTLKGNIDAELRAVLTHGGFDRAVFCPANPVQGRKVRAGILHVNGRRMKRVAAVFRGTPMEVTCPDASTEAHLRALATEGKTQAQRTLLAGSAGLSRHLAAARLPPGRARGGGRRTIFSPAAHAVIPGGRSRRVVIVAGSRNPVTQDQLRRLPRDAEIERIELPIHRVSAALLQRHLRRLRAALVQRPPHGVILTGGDTALAVCRILRVRTLELFGEVVPGIALSRALDGDLKGCWMATKPGGFGTPMALWRGIRRLRRL